MKKRRNAVLTITSTAMPNENCGMNRNFMRDSVALRWLCCHTETLLAAVIFLGILPSLLQFFAKLGSQRENKRSTMATCMRDQYEILTRRIKIRQGGAVRGHS